MHAQYQLSQKSSVRARVVLQRVLYATQSDSSTSAVGHAAVRKSSARLHHLREFHRARTQPQRPRSAKRPTSLDGSGVQRRVWVGGSVLIPYSLSAAVEVARPASIPGLRPGESACLGGAPRVPGRQHHCGIGCAAAPLRFVLLDTAVVILVDYGVK
jgi:hypothetical protein